MQTTSVIKGTAKKTILVVEDEEAVRRLIVLTLSQEYAVLEARDGQEALEMLGGMSQPPDAIILDGMMPRVDGLTFATFLKTQRGVRQVPIIMLTARGEFADVVRGINAGVRHYMTKPFKRDELRDRVKKLVG